MEIIFESDGLTKTQLAACLREAAGPSIAIETRDEGRTTMGDPGLLVAAITGGTSVLASIVAGLLGVVKQKKGSNITIEGKWGKVIIPADTPIQDTEAYIRMAKGPAERIRLTM